VFRAVKGMKNLKNGLQLKLGNVAKDEKGFDDLDEFWDAPGTWSTYAVLYCNSCVVLRGHP
jgi:hypothetical protein